MTPPERLQDVIAEMRRAVEHDFEFGTGDIATIYIAQWADRIEAAAALSVRGEPVAWLEPGTLNSCDASIFPALQRDYPDTYRGWFPVYATPPSEG